MYTFKFLCTIVVSDNGDGTEKKIPAIENMREVINIKNNPVVAV